MTLILILSWSKSSQNLFRKCKIQVYSSKLILSPLKYSPSTATLLCAWSNPRNIFYSVFGMTIRAVFNFSIIFSRLLKRVPRSGFLTRLNRKKSQRAKSGEFGGCWMVFVPFLVKKSRVMMALCDGALLWCKIHELFAYKFGLF